MEAPDHHRWLAYLEVPGPSVIKSHIDSPNIEAATVNQFLCPATLFVARSRHWEAAALVGYGVATVIPHDPDFHPTGLYRICATRMSTSGGCEVLGSDISNTSFESQQENKVVSL